MDLDKPGTLFWRGLGEGSAHDIGEHPFHNAREAAGFAMVDLPSRYRNEWLWFQTVGGTLRLEALAEIFSSGELLPKT